MNPPPYEEEMRKSTATQEEASLPKSGGESRQKSPDELPRKSVSPDDSSVRKSMVEELAGELSRSDVEDVNRMEDINRVEWNLSIFDFKQVLDSGVPYFSWLCPVPRKPRPCYQHIQTFRLLKAARLKEESGVVSRT